MAKDKQNSARGNVRDLKDIGEWGTRARSPLEILAEQDASRIPELNPVRAHRMAESPFAFYRGAAAVMAADLAAAPFKGAHVLSCGDAHLANFGLFGTPERRMAFDLNDFDESAVAPWDWDVKRLLTSVVLAAQANGEAPDEAWDAARRAARAYRKALSRLVAMTSIERFYAGVETERVLEMLESKVAQGGKKKHVKRAKAAASVVGKAEAKARRRTSERALRNFGVTDEDGQTRLIDQPPLTQHVGAMGLDQVRGLYRLYLESTDEDVRALLSAFEVKDVVLRVVGVGSVGTRCYIALLQDPQGTQLLLQFKEAQESVLSSYGKIRQPAPVRRNEQGHRVVAAQRILQYQSDRFLGYARGDGDEHSGGKPVDYYWRQFRDMKGGIDMSALNLAELTTLAKVCAVLLARAHAQSGAVLELAPLLKGRRDVDAALAGAALAYAEQAAADHAELLEAIDAGRIATHEG